MAIQDLVNQIESALPSIITKGLDTLIVNEGMDPWNDVYSCEESSHSSWMGCNFDYTAAVSVQKIEHLSSLYIKNLTQNGDIVDDGNGNYTVALDTKIKLTAEHLNVTASAPVTTNTCGIKINITPKDVMYINDLIATGTMTCTINLASATLVAAKMSSISTSYDNIDHNMSGLGAFDWMASSLASLFTSFAKSWINAELDPMIQSELNKELDSILPYKIF
jgi:hypothetical protein